MTNRSQQHSDDNIPSVKGITKQTKTKKPSRTSSLASSIYSSQELVNLMIEANSVPIEEQPEAEIQPAAVTFPEVYEEPELDANCDDTEMGDQIVGFEQPNSELLRPSSGKIPNEGIDEANLMNIATGFEFEWTHPETHVVMSELTNIEEYPALPYASVQPNEEEDCYSEKPMKDSKEQEDQIVDVHLPHHVLDFIVELIKSSSTSQHAGSFSSETIPKTEDNEDADDDHHKSSSFSSSYQYNYKDDDNLN